MGLLKLIAKRFLAISGTILMYLCSILLILLVLGKDNIHLPTEKTYLPRIVNKSLVHEAFPETRWEHMQPCGIYFNEQEAFQEALSCVNNVWGSNALPVSLKAPRCFIVSSSSPNLYYNETYGFNYVPVQFGGIVGVYQPETMTVFVTQNIDAKEIYQHEVSHYLLHLRFPNTGGGGHDQDIWKSCYEPTYSPSTRNQLIRKFLN